MTKKEAIKIFGSAKALADALGISEAAVSQWGHAVPELRVYQIRCIAASMQAGQQ
jgi:DNA-binding transcriptional regulator YdaS (Cro superfamily)